MISFSYGCENKYNIWHLSCKDKGYLERVMLFSVIQKKARK